MVKSKKKNETYSFIEYSHAKQVVKDFPKILNVYDNLLPVLYNYAQYSGVWEVIQSIEDSRMYMNIQYDYYKNVYNKKGKINNE